MRFLSPFWWLLALGASCSVGAVAFERLAPADRTSALGPASETSAAADETSVPSYASPAVVTQATLADTEGQPLAAAAGREGLREPASEPPGTPEAAPAAEPVETAWSGVSKPALLAEVPAKSTALLTLMNASRTREGLLELRRDATLDAVALARARDLVANGYFDHFSPDGESAFLELAARGVRYRLAGENLARNNYPDSRTVGAAFDGLMASPGHRANILEERFSLVGVAVVQSGRMWVYVTVFKD